jgi:DNA primase
MNPVEIIKEKINFVDLVGNYTKLKKAGNSYIGLCPFHEEKTPSFSINPDKKLFHCFGCGKGGDIINFIMEIENLSFKEAIEFLSEKYNIKLPKFNAGKSSLEQDIIKLNNLLTDYYHNSLFSPKGEKPLEYLLSRGFNKETIKEFKIGYSPDNFNELSELLKEYDFPPAILQRSGNFYPKNNRFYPFFKDRIMIPIKTHSGKIVAFGGRTYKDKKPKYKNSPETIVYKKRAQLFGLEIAKKYISEKNELILVEGYFDMISLFQHGITNVVASLGTSLTMEQINLMKRFADKVIIFYDFDSAGITAIKRAFPMFMEAGVFVEVFNGEKGLDPDDLIKEIGKDGFETKLKNNINPVYFFIGQKKITDSVEKKKILDKIIPSFSKVDDRILLEPYLKEISTLLDIDLQYLLDLMNKYKFADKEGGDKQLFTEEKIKLYEKIIISFLFNLPSKHISKYKPYFEEKILNILKYRKIVNSIISLKLSDYSNFDEKLKLFLTEQEYSFLYSIIYNNIKEYSENDFISAINELKLKYFENKLKNINKEIKESITNNQEKILETLLIEKNTIIKEMDNLSINNNIE